MTPRRSRSLAKLGVAAVLVEDIPGADAAMAELDGADPIGIDTRLPHQTRARSRSG